MGIIYFWNKLFLIFLDLFLLGCLNLVGCGGSLKDSDGIDVRARYVVNTCTHFAPALFGQSIMDNSGIWPYDEGYFSFLDSVGLAPPDWLVSSGENITTSGDVRATFGPVVLHPNLELCLTQKIPAPGYVCVSVFVFPGHIFNSVDLPAAVSYACAEMPLVPEGVLPGDFLQDTVNIWLDTIVGQSAVSGSTFLSGLKVAKGQ